MAIFEAMSLLALEPLLRTKCSNVPDARDALTGAPGDGLDPNDPHLRKALARAGAQAWLVLEGLLAGPAFWAGCHLFLSEPEWLELNQHAQYLLEKLRPQAGATFKEDQRRLCLRELHSARKLGLLLPIGKTPGERRLETGTPTEAAFPGLLRELRQAGLPHLAQVLKQDEQQEPLLARAAQHFLFHELEQNPTLLPGALPSQVEPPPSKQRKGFQLLARTMTSFGPGLQEWIEEDMSEANTSPMENTPLQPGLVVVEKPFPADGQKTAKAGPPAATPEELREGARQMRWGWLWALGMLCFIMVGVVWFISRFMAHEVRVYSGPQQIVTNVAFSPDGKLVAASSADGTIRIWDRNTGKELHVFNPGTGEAFGVSFSPDSKTLLTADLAAPRLYDVSTGTLLKKLDVDQNYILCAVYSPDGNYFATSSKGEGNLKQAEGKVRIWDANTFKQVHVLTGYVYAVTSLAYSPDGSQLIAGDGDVLILWDTATGKALRKIDEGTSGVACVAFAPDGKKVAYAGTKKLIQQWDLEENKPLPPLEGHQSMVTSLAYSPNGKQLISGSLGTKKAKPGESTGQPEEQSTIRVWSMTTGLENYHFENAREGVWSVAFAPDGSFVLTGGADKKVHLWWLP